jgi:hypothetical protein
MYERQLIKATPFLNGYDFSGKQACQASGGARSEKKVK